jgi:probable phosphoglycerate mutase
MRIIFARHGESEATVARVIANRSTGYRLTGRGHAQARALADALLASGTQAGPPGRTSGASLAIRSSPLLRARETADILGRVLGRPVIVDEALREADCGVMEGRSDEEAWAAHHAVQLRWAVGATSARIESGESMDEVNARFIPFVTGLVARATADDDVICVGHGSLFRCGLPAILRTADGAPFTPRDIGEAEALVATLDASGRLVADARTLPARRPLVALPNDPTR